MMWCVLTGRHIRFCVLLCGWAEYSLECKHFKTAMACWSRILDVSMRYFYHLTLRDWVSTEKWKPFLPSTLIKFWCLKWTSFLVFLNKSFAETHCWDMLHHKMVGNMSMCLNGFIDEPGKPKRVFASRNISLIFPRIDHNCLIVTIDQMKFGKCLCNKSLVAYLYCWLRAPIDHAIARIPDMSSVVGSLPDW